jgi:hypothetical protein
MDKNIKALRIKCTLPIDYLTNLPVGLEMLYIGTVLVNDDGNWTIAKELVDLNLPYTLNYFYVDINWYNPPFKLPYGCKMKRLYSRLYCHGAVGQKQQDKECPILNKMKSLYPDNQIKNIYSENQFRQYFKIV